MSEYPGDGSTPIPFVKIYGDVVVAPQPVVHVHDDVFLYVELVNMGTAPSNQGDTLTAFLSYDHGVLHQESVDFPPIPPDGGTWKHMFHFDGRFVVTTGEWVFGAMITNAGTIGEVQDDQRTTFLVTDRE